MQMKMKLLLSRRRLSESGTARDASRSITQEAAVCGLFAALIAVGAFMKIVIPVGADTMNFTLQWLFVLLAGLLLGSRPGIPECRRLSDHRPDRFPDFCPGRRPSLSAAANLWIFAGLCPGGMGYWLFM